MPTIEDYQRLYRGVQYGDLNVLDRAELLLLVEEKIRHLKNKPPKLLPCICGGKKRSHFFSTKNGVTYFLRCYKCGLASPECKKEAHLNAAWNKMIEEKKNAGK